MSSWCAPCAYLPSTKHWPLYDSSFCSYEVHARGEVREGAHSTVGLLDLISLQYKVRTVRTVCSTAFRQCMGGVVVWGCISSQMHGARKAHFV